ncbi:MAG: PKD domain-containing protein [Candidatus Absconditicoccaceae bacterium]
MTDPFFKTVSNASQNTNYSQEDNVKKIDEIQYKQKQLEQEFLKLNDYLKNNVLTNEQKVSVQQQMQQLDFQYKQNASILKSLGVGESSVKVNTQQKSGSKISMKQFLIGCAVILFLLVGGLSVIFYYLIGNPSQMSSVGVTPQTAKTLLQTFVVIFFGFLFLLGFALVIVNAYRLITVKNKSKIGYTMGTILGLIVFIFSIAFGSVLLSRIANISVGDLSDPNKLIRPSLLLKDGPIYILSDPTLKLIAPGIISFDINTSLFDSQILPKLGQVQIEGIQLDCGNGKNLDIDMKTADFNGSCIYYSKGNYQLNLIVSYVDSQTSEKLQKSFEAGNLNFESQIKITNKDNSVQNIPLDVIVGKVPSKVIFDASEVFKDFSLTDYNIVWDVDGDGSPDKTNDASFTYVYKEDKVYHVGIRFPNLNKYLYTFPIRVEQSDVPICEVVLNPIKLTQYNIKTNFLDSSVGITDYQFDIFDYQKGKIVDSIKSKKGYIDYTLPSKGTYSVIVNFITEEGKPGQCESDDIEIGQMNFDILYDIYYKSPQSPNFIKIDQKQSDMFQDGTLTIKEIPTILKLDITKITPDTPGLTRSVLINSKPILSSDNKSFQISLDENKDYEIKIIVEDINRGVKSEKIINVKIERDDVVGKLLITPDTVGMDPFTVQLDASTTIVNDSSDEIVYFTRDFGDGEIKKNFSQSIVSHTYRYDNKNENGEYFPKVTIKTKNGREIIIGSGTRIIVKKALVSLIINIDSHPAQTAKVGDKVDFSLEMNGLPKTMKWTFGDGNDIECKARECMTASKVYDKVGTYTVRVFVTFDNQPDLEGNITLKVQ